MRISAWPWVLVSPTAYCLAGTECQICIQAKDFTGTDRTCGMDEFSIRIEPPPPDDAAKELDEAAILEQSKSAEGYNDLYAIEPQVTAEEELKVLVMLQMRATVRISPSSSRPWLESTRRTSSSTVRLMGLRSHSRKLLSRSSPRRPTSTSKLIQRFYVLEGADPDQRALNEINSFDGPLLIADIVAKIKNIRDFAGKKKRGRIGHGARARPAELRRHGTSPSKGKSISEISLEWPTSTRFAWIATRACLHYLKARQLPVDRLFDQLGKALADWTEVGG